MNGFKNPTKLAFLITLLTLSTGLGASLTTINDCTGLQNMDDDLTEDYELGSDIDCSGTTSWSDSYGEGFSPIGWDESNDQRISNPEANNGRFSGTFDGNGYTISGLYMNRSRAIADGDNDLWDLGLFMRVQLDGGGYIRNVKLDDFYLETYGDQGNDDDVGLLIGGMWDTNDDSTISNIEVTNSEIVSEASDRGYGGVVGSFANDEGAATLTFEDITVDNLMVQGGRDSGCVVGSSQNYGSQGSTTIFNNIQVNDCTVKSNHPYKGGIIGNYRADGDERAEFTNLKVTNSEINITQGNSNRAGGIAGRIANYNTGNRDLVFNNLTVDNTDIIAAEYYAGGIIGDCAWPGGGKWDMQDVTLTNSYVESRSQQRVGGICGYFRPGDPGSSAEIRDVTIDNNVIKSENNNEVGGAFGWFRYYYEDLAAEIYNVEVTNTNITGRYQAGGFMGKHSGRDDTGGSQIDMYDITLDNNIIETRGSGQAGGFVGRSDTDGIDAYFNVSDIDISGGSVTALVEKQVGGFSGRWNTRNDANTNITDVTIENMEIESSTSDEVGGMHGRMLVGDSQDTEHYENRNVVKKTSMFSSGGQIGGHTGYLYNYMNGTININQFSGRQIDLESEGCCVGGITGQVRNRGGGLTHYKDFHAANVDIDSTSDSRVGAIGGNIYKQFKDLTAPGETKYENGYFSGTTSNVDWVFARDENLTVTDVYWDEQRSNSVDSTYATGLTTGEMYGSNSSSNMDFNFGSIWTDKSYPFFQWQELLVPEELPSPADGETAVDYDPTNLEIRPWDHDGDNVDVEWFDADSESSVGTDTVGSGNLASTGKSTITAENHTYYAVLSSGSKKYTTREFEFATMSPFLTDPAPEDGTTQPENRSLTAIVDHEDGSLSMDVDYSIDGSNVLSQTSVSPGTNVTDDGEVLERGTSYTWCINITDSAGGSKEFCKDFDIESLDALPPTASNPVDGEIRVFPTSGDGVTLEVDVEHPQYTVDSMDVSFISPEDGTIATKTINARSGTVQTDWTKGETKMYGFDRGEQYEWYVSIDDQIETIDNQNNKFTFRVQEPPIIPELSPKGGSRAGFLNVESVFNPVDVSSMDVNFEVRSAGSGNWVDVGTDAVSDRNGSAGVGIDSLSKGQVYYWRPVIDDGYSSTTYSDLTEPFVASNRVWNKPDWFNQTFRLPLKYPSESTVVDRTSGDDGLIWIDSNQLYWYDPSNSETYKLRSPKTIDGVNLPEGTIWVEGTDFYWVGEEDTKNNLARRYTGSLVATGVSQDPGDVWLGSGGSIHYVDENGDERSIG